MARGPADYNVVMQLRSDHRRPGVIVYLAGCRHNDSYSRAQMIAALGQAPGSAQPVEPGLEGGQGRR